MRNQGILVLTSFFLRRGFLWSSLAWDALFWSAVEQGAWHNWAADCPSRCNRSEVSGFFKWKKWRWTDLSHWQILYKGRTGCQWQIFWASLSQWEDWISMSGLEDGSSINKLQATFWKNNCDIFKANIPCFNLHLDIHYNIFTNILTLFWTSELEN